MSELNTTTAETTVETIKRLKKLAAETNARVAEYNANNDSVGVTVAMMKLRAINASISKHTASLEKL